MNRTLFFGVAFLLMIGIVPVFAEDRAPIKVLLIGNSQCPTIVERKLIENLAASDKEARPLKIRGSIRGGASLKMHWDAGTGPDIDDRGTWPNVSFHCFQAQLRGGMATGTAGHTRMNLQPQAAWRGGIPPPWRNQKESLAHEHRRPSVLRHLHPVSLGFHA